MYTPSRALLASGLCLLALLGGCTRNAAGTGSEQEPMARRTIQQVLEEHTSALMAVPGGVGTGIGLCDGRRCIKVLVEQETREVKERVPPTLEGYPFEIELRRRFRPFERPRRCAGGARSRIGRGARPKGGVGTVTLVRIRVDFCKFSPDSARDTHL